MIQGKRQSLITLTLVLLIRNSRCFVVVGPRFQRDTQVATKRMALLLEQSSQSFGSRGSDPKPRHNIFNRALSAISSWFRPKSEVEVVLDDDDEDVELLLSPEPRKNELMKKQMNDELKQYPWPIRATGESISRSVSRALSKEERKAKPMLKDSLRLIRKDKDLEAVLGKPLQIGHVFSTSSSTRIVNNWKKTRRIVDSFEIFGSQRSGVATMVADKYSKGHIRSLRVDVGGIHYDIDVNL